MEPAAGGKRTLPLLPFCSYGKVTSRKCGFAEPIGEGIVSDLGENANNSARRVKRRLARRLPSRVCTMIRSRSLVLLLVLAFIHPALVATPVAAAEERGKKVRSIPTVDPRDGRYQRLRTIDARLRQMIDDGMLTSGSFRALVERLEQSDVVVYVQCEGVTQTRVAGRLTFVSTAGGLRYVLVRLARLNSRPQQIAILAHELQHAIEIADSPSIVDGESLAREYYRFGHVNRVSQNGVTFDTIAAVEMGERVLGEIIATAGD
jgi:hypothetical protein